MPPDPFPAIQRSFVLRVWIEPQSTSAPIWRCVLLDPHSGSRIGFSSPADLAAYLTTCLPFDLDSDEEESSLPKG